MNIKATPTEIEITGIVSELVHDGFMELDQADILLLEQRTHEGYKHIADMFQLWALALINRRMSERLAATQDYAAWVAEQAAAFDAEAQPVEFDKLLAEWDDDCTTTTGDV